MKSVIYFIFKDDNNEVLNKIDKINNFFDYKTNYFIITDCLNLHKTLYSKVQHIFYFKNKFECIRNLNHVISYLELFHYKEILLLNSNKEYLPEDIIFKSISTVKEDFAIINNII